VSEDIYRVSYGNTTRIGTKRRATAIRAAHSRMLMKVEKARVLEWMWADVSEEFPAKNDRD
jgi:hypothetical protein